MHVFEIHIFTRNVELPSVSQEMHLTLNSALRSARRMAGGKRLEIWRDGICVYRTPVRLRSSRCPLPAPSPEEAWIDVIRHNKAQQSLHSLVAAVNALPLAVVLFDRDGEILCHSGAAERVLGASIAARDPDHRPRWQMWDSSGMEVGPRDWPGVRALRGEFHAAGFGGVYRYPDGRARHLHLTAMPLSDGRGFEGGATLMQDMDPAHRHGAGFTQGAANRFVRTFFESLDKLARVPNGTDTAKVLRDLNRTLDLVR